MKNLKENLLAILRISMGWIFLWSFLDKLFGLGFSTTTENAWINGGSPTYGFLTLATKGPLASFYQSITGPFTDWLFMAGLLLIGIALILGIANKLSGYTGALLVFFMWTAVLPPKQNPILDEHIIYLLVLLVLANVKTKFSLNKAWTKTKIVKKYPILE